MNSPRSQTAIDLSAGTDVDLVLDTNAQQAARIKAEAIDRLFIASANFKRAAEESIRCSTDGKNLQRLGL